MQGASVPPIQVVFCSDISRSIILKLWGAFPRPPIDRNADPVQSAYQLQFPTA